MKARLLQKQKNEKDVIARRNKMLRELHYTDPERARKIEREIKKEKNRLLLYGKFGKKIL